MRLATIVTANGPAAAVVEDRGVLALPTSDPALASIRAIAAGGVDGLARVRRWIRDQPASGYRPIGEVRLGPAVPDPGAIYTIGLNYATPGEPAGDLPERPLVYAKLPASVARPGALLAWDRGLTGSVDPEAELGVVIGETADRVDPAEALEHVLGYTCVDDVSSRDPWLDGDQWLLGKSMPGFCPIGPWIVTRDELAPDDLRIGCSINGVAIQDDTTAHLRFSIGEVVAFISRHVPLRPGDVIATGTPARLPGPPGPERHLEPGDVVTVRIERIGELSTTVGERPTLRETREETPAAGRSLEAGETA